MRGRANPLILLWLDAYELKLFRPLLQSKRGTAQQGATVVLKIPLTRSGMLLLPFRLRLRSISILMVSVFIVEKTTTVWYSCLHIEHISDKQILVA